MAQPATIAVPIVHRNGTSKESLIEQRQAVRDLLEQSYQALKQAYPNSRDSYLEPGLQQKLDIQHTVRLAAIQSVIDSLDTEIQKIDEQ